MPNLTPKIPADALKIQIGDRVLVNSYKFGGEYIVLNVDDESQKADLSWNKRRPLSDLTLVARAHYAPPEVAMVPGDKIEALITEYRKPVFYGSAFSEVNELGQRVREQIAERLVAVLSEARGVASSG